MGVSKEDAVKSFFDNISERYSDFDQDGHALHGQRLQLSIKGLSFSEKSILDIGAGTGMLHNVIQEKGGCGKYQAIDLSEKMLSKSHIPQADKFVGSFYNFESEDRYDFIFALGLTNYLSKSGNADLKEFILSHLSKDGVAVISYTNANSLINRLKTMMVKFLPQNQDRTLTSRLSRSFYTPSDVEELWPPISNWCFFNHAYNRSHLSTQLPSKQLFYSDFLIEVSKKNYLRSIYAVTVIS